jgi:hypothetical protein
MSIRKKKYKCGDTVTLITDKDQNKRIVTGIMTRRSEVQYEVSLCGSLIMVYEYEITSPYEAKSDQSAIGFKNQACLS